LVVAGFVATADEWVEFNKFWKERLTQDGIEYFHAVEFAHSVGEFASGWNGNEPRRRALLADLMTIIKRHVSRKFADVVINEALDKMSNDTKAQFHINAYSLAGRSCVARLREWLHRERWETVPGRESAHLRASPKAADDSRNGAPNRQVVAAHTKRE
jgi:hypothetical protein